MWFIYLKWYSQYTINKVYLTWVNFFLYQNVDILEKQHKQLLIKKSLSILFLNYQGLILFFN